MNLFDLIATSLPHCAISEMEWRLMTAAAVIHYYIPEDV